uniref:Ig-like domain-containing protein n=1 Tax=Callorhinchus milii TaxID=7868 RepID=A0A4W3H694_CALMI
LDSILSAAIRAILTTSKIIHQIDSERDSSKSLTLVCETAEFYPGDVTLTWNKDGSEVKTGIDLTEAKNSKGLYKASRSMEETQPVQSGAVYTCLVSHITLRIPVVAVYTVSESNKGNLTTWRRLAVAFAPQ